MRLPLLIVLLGALATPIRAQTPPEGLVWMALRDVNDAHFNRDEPMNRPPLVKAVPEGMIQAVDVSPDGRPDWLVDYSKAGIADFCGTGGCRQLLYVSGEDGDYVPAFTEQAHALTVRAGVVEAWVHHNYCEPDTVQCRYAYAWDALLKRLVERPNSRGQTLLSGGGFVPRTGETPEPVHLHEDISPQFYGLRARCPDQSDLGVALRWPVVRDTPDLNGDSVRDWLIEPAACLDAPLPPFQVWVSEGEGMRQAYASAAERHPAIDIRQTPALLIDNPACGHGEPCPNRPLGWDAAAGTFKPLAD